MGFASPHFLDPDLPVVSLCPSSFYDHYPGCCLTHFLDLDLPVVSICPSFYNHYLGFHMTHFLDHSSFRGSSQIPVFFWAPQLSRIRMLTRAQTQLDNCNNVEGFLDVI